MSFISESRKVISKIVNGKQIYKAKDTHGFFYVDIAPNKTMTFRTIKEAEKFIKYLM